MTDLSQMTDDELLELYQQERAKADPGKPLPVGVQKMEADDLDAIFAAGSTKATMAKNLDRLGRDELKLGPVANLVSEGRNWAGMSDANSRNYSSFRSDLEKMRNDSLRLNKGVQTEGDAQRAWNELLKNVNDEELVAQRLQEIQGINDRALQFRTQVVNQRRSQYGAPLIDPDDYAPKSTGGAMPWAKSLPEGVRAQLPRAPADNQPSKAVIGEIERMKKVGEWDGAKPRGSEANPFVAVNPRIAARLPKGSYYLDAKGDLYVQD